MDIEKVTEELIRLAMEQNQLKEEYQVLLDFSTKCLDLESTIDEDEKNKGFRNLIDELNL